MELFTLGIDLGRTTFHLAGMNQRGRSWCATGLGTNVLLSELFRPGGD
jgi:hypothetical protein